MRKASAYRFLALSLLAASPAHAGERAQVALVVGSGAYAASASTAPSPGCTNSAHNVAKALKGVGFDVGEVTDPGLGQFDAAVGAFAKKLRETPDAAGVVYVCGALSSYNSRVFLLPVSARLERETDVMTQGVLARTMLNAMVSGHVHTGLIALDGTTPTSASPADLKTLADAAATAGVGMAVSLSAPGADATAFSAALVKGLAGPQVQLASLLDGLRTNLPATSLVAVSQPANAGYLAGEPQAAPTPPPPPAPPSAPIAAAPVAPPPPVVATTPPPPILPDESIMVETDRKRVQTALSTLGYYSGTADGVFGANTRAAIKRFQFEIGVPMTGILTSEQASRLVRPR